MTKSTMVVSVDTGMGSIDCHFVGELIVNNDDYKLYHQYNQDNATVDSSIVNIKAIKVTDTGTECLVSSDKEVKSGEIGSIIPWRYDNEIQIFVNNINDKVSEIRILGAVNKTFTINMTDKFRINCERLGINVVSQYKCGEWRFSIKNKGRNFYIKKYSTQSEYSKCFSDNSELLVIGSDDIDNFSPENSPKENTIYL